MVRYMVQTGLQFTPVRMDIIEAAKAGDPDAIEALRALLLECKAQHTDMPSDLIEYEMWCLRYGERRHQRPGPKKKSYILRDLCIAMTVAVLVDRYGHHGMARRRGYRRDSLARSAQSSLKRWA